MKLNGQLQCSRWKKIMVRFLINFTNDINNNLMELITDYVVEFDVGYMFSGL